MVKNNQPEHHLNKVLAQQGQVLDLIRARPDVFHKTPSPEINPDQWVYLALKSLILASLEKIPLEGPGEQVVQKLGEKSWWEAKPESADDLNTKPETADGLLARRLTDAFHYADLLGGDVLVAALSATLEEQLSKST